MCVVVVVGGVCGGQKRIERLREDGKRNGVWRESEGQMGWGRGGLGVETEVD